MMNTNLVYEDTDGIRYECIGFDGDQFKMEVVDSPFPHISEGVIEWMDDLPTKTLNKEEMYR